MKLKNVILFVLFIQFACGNKTNLTVKEKIIADIEDQGFQFIGACKPPSGISDTLLVGYTDRHPKTGIFYLKELRPKGLTIQGLEFEAEENNNFTKVQMIYLLDFKDKAEKQQFKEFQTFVSNYQTHYKNSIDFYQIDSTWVIHFTPMP